MGARSAAFIAFVAWGSWSCGLTAEGGPTRDGGVAPVVPLPTGTTSPTTTPVQEAPPPVDAGGVAPDASTVGTDCVQPSVFANDGDTSLRKVASDGTVTLTLGSNKRAAIKQTFTAKQPFTRSRVEVLLDMEWNNSWGLEGADYLQFFREYYGPDTSGPAYNHIVFAQNVLEGHIQPANTGAQGLGGIGVPKATGVTLRVETTWGTASSGGQLQVTTTPPGKSHTLANQLTASTGTTSSTLTLVVGGTGFGTVADVVTVIRRVCVYFDP